MANLVNFQHPVSLLPSKLISPQVGEDYMVRSDSAPPPQHFSKDKIQMMFLVKMIGFF